MILPTPSGRRGALLGGDSALYWADSQVVAVVAREGSRNRGTQPETVFCRMLA